MLVTLICCRVRLIIFAASHASATAFRLRLYIRAFSRQLDATLYAAARAIITISLFTMMALFAMRHECRECASMRCASVRVRERAMPLRASLNTVAQRHATPYHYAS